jgi:hypothetical protein
MTTIFWTRQLGRYLKKLGLTRPTISHLSINRGKNTEILSARPTPNLKRNHISTINNELAVLD